MRIIIVKRKLKSDSLRNQYDYQVQSNVADGHSKQYFQVQRTVLCLLHERAKQWKLQETTNKSPNHRRRRTV